MYNKSKLGHANDEYMDTSSTSLHSYLSALVAISSLAVVTNTVLLFTTCAVRNIRRSTSSIFLVHLCLVDILASLTVLVVSLAILSGHPPEMSRDWRTLLGCIQEFCKSVIVLTILQITCEKYMYIVHPMRHESCLTTGRSFACLCITWAIGLLFGSLPEFTYGKYVIPKLIFPLRVVWDKASVDQLIAVLFFLVLFILPIVTIAVISFKLYRVVKHAMIAVEPAPNPLLPSCPSAATVRKKYSTVFVVDISEPSEKQRMNNENMKTKSNSITLAKDYTGDQNKNSVSLEVSRQYTCTNESLNITNSDRNRVSQRMDSQEQNGRNTITRKAFALLTLPVCYFILVWLPIGIQDIIVSQRGTEHGFEILETISFIILQTSYAINPVFYSFLSKSFRHDAIKAIKTCCAREDNFVRPFSLEGSNEDFLQFLNRTSGSAQGERDKGRMVDSNEANGEVILLNSFPENSSVY